MACVSHFAIPVMVALCLLSLPTGYHAARPKPKLKPKAPTKPEQFRVEGDVYCEVCRLNFINRLSEPMPGAIVKLECRGDQDPKNITYSKEGYTDKKGHYNIKVKGDHASEDCTVKLVKSSRRDCEEIPTEGFGSKPAAMITLTDENGFHDDMRYANPLGFSKKVPAAACAQLVKELRIDQQT